MSQRDPSAEGHGDDIAVYRLNDLIALAVWECIGAAVGYDDEYRGQTNARRSSGRLSSLALGSLCAASRPVISVGAPGDAPVGAQSENESSIKSTNVELICAHRRMNRMLVDVTSQRLRSLSSSVLPHGRPIQRRTGWS